MAVGLQHVRHRHAARRCRQNRILEQIGVGFSIQDREQPAELSTIDLRQSLFVIEQVAVLDGRGPGTHEQRAAFGDGAQFSRASLKASPTPLAFQTLAQRDGDRPGHGVASQLRQIAGEPARSSFLMLRLIASLR